MPQLINLYRDDLVKVEHDLNLQQIASILVVVLVINVLIAMVLVGMTLSTNAEIAELTSTKKSLERELTSTSAELQPAELDLNLETTLSTLKKEERRRNMMLKVLLTRDEYIDDGFYSVLKDLYDKDPKGVWLRSIKFDDYGSKINLEGWVTQPDLLPKYLEALKKTDSFSGKQFDLFHLDRDEQNPEYLMFKLATEHDPEENYTETLEKYVGQVRRAQ